MYSVFYISVNVNLPLEGTQVLFVYSKVDINVYLLYYTTFICMREITHLARIYVKFVQISEFKFTIVTKIDYISIL